MRPSRERVEEAVARVIDLLALVRTESLPQSPTVVGQRLLESLGTEFVEQRRRTLDVREHERHRSRWLQRHRRMICREQLQHKRSVTGCRTLPAVRSRTGLANPDCGKT